jgi:hypothetical protein
VNDDKKGLIVGLRAIFSTLRGLSMQNFIELEVFTIVHRFLNFHKSLSSQFSWEYYLGAI